MYLVLGTPMKPVARLHLIKQREYEKRCPPGARNGNGAFGNPSIGYNAGGNSYNMSRIFLPYILALFSILYKH